MFKSIDRRALIKSGAAATLGAATGVFAPAIARAANRVIKIGYVSPQTGPLAAFAGADAYLLDGVRATVKGGVKLGNEDFTLEFLVRDSQSNPEPRRRSRQGPHRQRQCRRHGGGLDA